MFSFKKISSKFHFIATGKVIKVKIKDDKPKVSFFLKLKNKINSISDKTVLTIAFIVGFILVVAITATVATKAEKGFKKSEQIKEDPIKVMLMDSFKKEREKAFFWGQKAAIEGDIRVKKINDSTWIWIKSPWNDGTQPSIVTLHVDKGRRK
jgi:hypothetical protein